MFNVPTQRQNNVYSIDEFKGVDFTSSPIEVDKRRSPKSINMICKNGKNEKRNGYNILNNIGSCINGVWNIDTPTSEVFLVHSGNALYQTDNEFKNKTLILNGMSNNRSIGLYINGYLVIFDGVRAVVFACFDGINYEAKFLDSCGYEPITSIGRDSNGGGTEFEKINLISPYRINMFLSAAIESGIDEEGNPTYTAMNKFPLDDTNIDSIELVQKMTNDAEWVIVTDYTFDLEKGEVYFTPGDPPVIGRDNVKIKYKKTNTENVAKINNCSVATLYGYESNNNRIFVTGNSDYPNYDFWCEQNNPLYWPDENFARIGTQPILGYSKLNDGTLSILKAHSDTDDTISYRDYNLLNEIEVFPIKSGAKNLGCISKYAFANLLNDPLYLTNQGVFAIVGNNGEKFAMQRSYYINGKLLQESNLEEAIAIAVDGKYYLGINNHVYVADSRYLSYPKNAKTEQYQYEWWYWEDIPARVFFSWNEKLYFGTSQGAICEFTDKYKDNNVPVEAYWETPFIDFGIDSYTKSIKNETLILNPGKKCDIDFGYITDEETNLITSITLDDQLNNFPRTIYEKDKIRKFMFIKFYMKNITENNLTFERLILEYITAGRYKGE